MLGVGALVVLGALLLRDVLQAVGTVGVAARVQAIAPTRLVGALALTVAEYAVLCTYDVTALRYAGIRLPLGRLVATSAAAYAVSQMLGFAVVTGNLVRIRYWSRWGLSLPEIGRATLFAGWTFLIGIGALLGAALVLEPRAPLVALPIPPALARVLGAVCLAGVGAYLVCTVRRGGRAVALGPWDLPFPAPRLAVGQLLLVTADWTAAALVLRVLLPDGAAIPLVPYLAAYVLAQSAALVSHVPGGVGVFDTGMVLFLRPVLPTDAVLAALIGYRTIYYVVPFVVAVLALGILGVGRSTFGAHGGRWLRGVVRGACTG